jgi:hypothetical protein
MMTPEERDQMSTLCREIQAEQDPARFVVLIEELAQLLTHKDKQPDYAGFNP